MKGCFAKNLMAALLLMSASTASAQATSPAPAAPKTTAPKVEPLAPLTWQTSYRDAYAEAKRDKKYLLIVFQGRTASSNSVEASFQKKLDTDRTLRSALDGFVVMRMSVDSTIQVEGNPVRLLSHPAFREMHGLSGIAILDLKHEGEEYYGGLVSAFPFSSGKYYHPSASHLNEMLTLPSGTITQRTMIWAVRTHPEGPASTRGSEDKVLVNEARSHSRYQARIGVQGHHNWGQRFARILGLRGRGAPVEVVAESWPSQTMLDSCIDCVASWRQSDGHWNAVRAYHASYGYDIKQGSNGIWYGTGIFSD